MNTRTARQNAIEKLPTPLDGAHAVFQILADWGVDLLFTCPGSTEAAALDASLDFPMMRVILTLHEGVAVSAADAYARILGKPAIAYLHANVGLANGISHLSCAQTAGSPVVILNGIKSTAISNRDGFTSSPFQQDMVRQFVKRSRVALSTEGIPGDLVRTLQAAISEPTGPVYLGLPQNLMEGPVTQPLPLAVTHRFPAKLRPDSSAVQLAAGALGRARAVTIVAGSEIAFSSEARRLLLTLAERLDAPIVLEDRRTFQAAGITGDHPSFAGAFSLTSVAVAAADVLLYAGMRSFTEFEEMRGPFQPADTTIIHLCSDALEIAKLAPVSIALPGNVESGLSDLLAALNTGPSVERAAHWKNATAAFRSETEARRTAMRKRFSEMPINPEVFVEALNECLPTDCFIINEAITTGGYLADALIPYSGREHLGSAGGSLGWGLGAAVGAQLALPQKRIVSIVGDGAFHFGVQALFTARQLDLAITYIVVDNESYAAVRAALKRYRKGEHKDAFPGCDISGPDLAEVARGYGAFACQVERLSDLPDALREAFSVRGPSVVVVKTDPAHSGP